MYQFFRIIVMGNVISSYRLVDFKNKKVTTNDFSISHTTLFLRNRTFSLKHAMMSIDRRPVEFRNKTIILPPLIPVCILLKPTGRE